MTENDKNFIKILAVLVVFLTALCVLTISENQYKVDMEYAKRCAIRLQR